MRLSVKIFPGVWLSGSTRRRKRRRKTTYHWTHGGCSIQHRTEDAANRCAARAAEQKRRVAAEVAGSKDAIKQRATRTASELGREASHGASAGIAPEKVGREDVREPINHERRWAHIYFASELERRIRGNANQYAAHEEHGIREPREPVTDHITDLKRRIDTLDIMINYGMAGFSPEILARAFASDGDQGDEEAIRLIAQRIDRMDSALMSWAASARGACADEWMPVYLALSESVDAPIREIRRFSTDLSLRAKDLIRAQQTGVAHKLPEMKLDMTIDRNVQDRYSAALSKVKANAQTRSPVGLSSEQVKRQ